MPQDFTTLFPDSDSHLGDVHCYIDKVVTDGVTKADRHFRYLFSDVFQHHHTPQPPHAIVRPAAQASASRLLQRDDLSVVFRDIYLSDFTLAATSSAAPEDLAARELPYAAFLEQITATSIRPGTTAPVRNHLSFVTGDAGSGKSLLMAKLLDDVMRENRAPKPARLRRLPLYIDIEATWRPREGKFDDIDPSFYRMIYSRLQDATAARDLPLSEFMLKHGAALASDDPVSGLNRLCSWLLSQRYSALFIFDHLDRFQFAHTRYSFFEEYRHEQSQSVKENVLALYRRFQDPLQLGALSATVIMVCRSDLFRCLHERYDGGESRPSNPEPVFLVSGVDAVDALRGRAALLGHAIDSVRDVLTPAETTRYDKAKSILDRALVAAQDSTNLNDSPLHILGYIQTLSTRGAGSLLDFLTRLEFDSHDDGELLARVLETSPRHLLRLYVTDLRKRFREARNHFPNLFLNDASVDAHDDHPYAHRPAHRQTYWLKFLVLKVLQTRPDGSLQFGELRRLLCEICGYEDTLLRLVVGNLSTQNQFRCIDPHDAGGGIEQRRLCLSNRGRLLMGDPTAAQDLYRNPFCFSLEYLQLVTDDPWLRYPAPWSSAIALPNVHLGHLLKTAQRYRADSLQYLRKKIPATLLFLRVLDASWKSESQRIAELPSALQQLIEPRFDEIAVRLLSDAGKMLRAYIGAEGIHSEWRDYWRHLRSDAAFDNWWLDFRRTNPAVRR
jgi:hypothetical protein